MRIQLRRHHRTCLLIVTSACALSGCLTVWNTTAGPQKSSTLAVTADLPEGWARLNPDRDLAMTRDGFLLQSIRVTRDVYGAKLENTDRTLAKGMDGHDAAQVLLDSFSADQSRHQLTVVDNRPATVAGREGLRLEITYRTAEGLTMHEIIYVALIDDSYVTAVYSAPERHYFERMSGDFEKVVASLKIDGPAPRGLKKS